MTVGDGRKRDPEATRHSILEAAERLFVERGFAGTSMNDVARDAEVTKSLIHHHFGSKEELWTEVKRRLVSQWAELQKEILTSEDGSLLMKRSIESYFAFLAQHPSFVRLASWMSLEDPRLSEPVHPDLIALAIDRIAREQARGGLRSDVEPKHILAMFLGLNTYWFTSRGFYREGAGVGTQGEVADRAYLGDMIRVFLSGLRPEVASVKSPLDP